MNLITIINRQSTGILDRTWKKCHRAVTKIAPWENVSYVFGAASAMTYILTDNPTGIAAGCLAYLAGMACAKAAEKASTLDELSDISSGLDKDGKLDFDKFRMACFQEQLHNRGDKKGLYMQYLTAKEHGGAKELLSDKNFIAFRLAAHSNRANTVRFLINKAREHGHDFLLQMLNAKDMQGYSMADEKGHAEVKKIIKAALDECRSILPPEQKVKVRTAPYVKSSSESARYPGLKGANLHPFRMACFQGRLERDEKSQAGITEFYDAARHQGKAANLLADSNFIALPLAVYSGNTRAVKTILDAARREGGDFLQTMLHARNMKAFALSHEKGHVEIYKLIRDAFEDCPDHTGKPAFAPMHEPTPRFIAAAEAGVDLASYRKTPNPSISQRTRELAAELRSHKGPQPLYRPPVFS